MKIQELAPVVIKRLRSDVAFTSVAHCIEELVWNAIDAHASCIAIRLNLPFYRIQVVDNGNGIPPDEMKLVGTRYATSKCHSLEDLENLKYGGFRGEALSSLKEVSSILMIESRSAGSDETYCKIFTKGIASKPKRSRNSRPSKGTTVTVLDFMYNMPVRRSTISEALDLEDTRKLLQSIALVHPGISFSLQNEATSEICFHFKKCSSILNAFIQLFGKSKSENIKHIQGQFDEYEIQGYLSTDSYFSKDLQFLYVNHRLVLKTKIHKLINNTLKRALFTKQLSKLDILDSSSSSKNNFGKNQIQYGIFVLNILCPYSKYDAVFDRRRTIIEFKDSDKISKLVEGALLSFLRKEKLICISEEENKLEPSNITFNPNEITDAYNYKNGLFSHPAKRLNTVSVLPETSRSASASEDSCPVESISLHPARNDESIYNKPSFTAEFNNSSSLSSDSTEFEHIASNGNKINKDQNNKKDIQNVEQSRAGQNLVTLKQGTTNGSILDVMKLKCKFTSISNTNNNINDNIINSLESSAEILDIPSRSVFPTKSPIMLRAPAKSTLSLFQKKYPQSDALIKLKQKYQFIPNKCEKNLISNLSCYDAQKRKSLQHTPAVSESQSKVLSKYSFKSEPKPLALQKLSRFNKVSAKSRTKNLHLDRDISDNSSYESDVSKTKKIKSVVENFPDHNMYKHHSVTNEVIKSANSVCLFENSSVSKNFKEINVGLKVYSHENDHIDGNSTIRSQNLKSTSNLRSDQYNTFLLQTFTVTDKSNNSQNNNILNDTSHSNYFTDHVFCPEVSKGNVSECPLKRQTDCELISPGICIPNSATVESEVQVFVEDMKNIATNTETETKLFNSNCDMSLNKQNAHSPSKVHNEKLNNSEARCDNCDNNYAFPEEQFETHEVCNKKCISPISESRNLVSRPQSEFDLETSPIIPEQHKNAINHAFNTDIKEFNSIVQHSDVSEILAVSAETDFIYNSHSTLKSKKELIPVVQGTANNDQFSYPSQTVFDIRNEKLLLKSNTENSDYLEAEFEYEKFNCERSVISSNKCEPSRDIHENIQISHATELSLVNQRLEVESANCPNKPSICTSEPVINKYQYESQNEEIEIITEIPCLEEGDANLNLDKSYESLTEKEQDRGIRVNILNIPEQNNCMYVSSVDRKNKEAECTDFINCKTSAENFFNSEMKNNETNSINTLMVKSFENKSCQTVTDAEVNSVDEKTVNDKLVGIRGSNRWICQTDPETKRVTYIDRITGNSSFFMPEQKEVDETLEPSSGNFKKGHFFLSHDFSPFMPKKSCPSIADDAAMSNFQTELTDFVENNEKKEWNCKWRDNKQESFYCDNNVEEMLNNWENPMFNISSEANCTNDLSISQNVPQMYGVLNSYRFSKSTLQSLQVIGQVDCKFIACILKDFNEGCNDQKLLALFDQHAVHERIRLEELTEELYETIENGERRIKSIPITPSLQITLESEEIRLLHAYHMYLQQIGIQLSLNNDSNVIDVYSIPAIFIEKETKELRKKLSEVSSLVEKIIREWLTSLIQTRSVSYIMPKTLSSVLNSQACRGAVKFGDPLNLSQCENLLNLLSNCNLPFQCAHGRPSIAPILDIKKIDALCEKRLPPKLGNLSLKMSNNLL